jgi:aldehyde:ferredoxin oxidoreductase
MRQPAPGGYFGRALIVDLGTGASRVAPLEESVLRGFIRSAGLGTWLMHRYCPPGVEPLAPEAPSCLSSPHWWGPR